MLGDDLVGVSEGKMRKLSGGAHRYHAAKAVSHMAVALYTLLSSTADADLEPATRARLTRLDSAVRHVGEGLEVDPHGDAKAWVSELLTLLSDLTREVLASGTVSSDRLRTFARKSGPLLLKLTEHATREALGRLHALVEEALSGLDAATYKTLQVVVAGDHPPRSRSLGMRYFRRRFSEPEDSEYRVAYGENVTTVEEALALVGTRRLDRAIAGTLVGDETFAA